MINYIKTVLVLVLFVSSICLHAATTAFNYQGQVIYEGVPANGSFDVQFNLYDNPDNMGINTELASFIQTVEIENGLLNTELDFGDIFFDGQDLWIQLAIERPNGPPGFFVLMPRVPINPAPYAIQAQFTELGSSPWIINSNDISYSAGKVGIGTSNPVGLLHLNGSSADELSLYGVNSTPVIHFRRANGNVDWVMKQSSDGVKFHIQTELADGNEVLTLTSSGRLGVGTESPDGFLDVRDGAGDTLLNVNDDGSIERKIQTRTTYVSYKSFIPESNVFTYSTLSFLGFTGLHSTYTGGGPAKFHADVALPEDAVITQISMIAGDNSGTG